MTTLIVQTVWDISDFTLNKTKTSFTLVALLLYTKVLVDLEFVLIVKTTDLNGISLAIPVGVQDFNGIATEPA